MNIEKLAKHLKEFTLNEIEMIAECDCKADLVELSNRNKIAFENGKYKYIEQESLDFDIFVAPDLKNKNISFENAVKIFLEEYAKKYCKIATYKKYSQQFKYDITPYFEKLKINDITVENIKDYYQWCQNRNFLPLKIKNTLALLKQFIKYFQEQGLIDTKCVFQVRRLTAKNEFSENRLIFKENL